VSESDREVRAGLTETVDKTKKASRMSSDEVSMPVWQEKHLRAATTAAGVALSWNVDTDAITMDVPGPSQAA
jgi:hypothetical protein